MNEHSARIWGITDGSAGMQSQVQGVLQALGESYEIKTCKRSAPWVWLPVTCNRFALSQLTKESDRLEPPWPDALVTSGRRSASLALAIKRKSGGRTKIIHLTDPRGCRGKFDLIVAMAHDHADGNNVMKTRFALHRVTPSLLAEAGEAWKPRLAHLPRPYIAVLIGGSTNKYTLTTAAMQRMVTAITEIHEKEAGSLLITPSRRTGEANITLLRDAFKGRDRVMLHDLTGENPYLGMLALADHIVVTDDSVNMLSEAAATGKPVHILKLPGHQDTKPARFAHKLMTDEVARTLALPLQTWSYKVADDMQEVVKAIRKLLRI